MNLKDLIGSGDKIVLFTLPFLIVGLLLNVAYPDGFEVGGPPPALRAIAIVLLVTGVAIWVWSILLILTTARRGRLITGGPFAVVKHPIYTAVALLVFPAVGFLLDSWLGVAIGVVMYVASRRYAPAEEATLSRTFGPAWDEYAAGVKIPWL